MRRCMFFITMAVPALAAAQMPPIVTTVTYTPEAAPYPATNGEVKVAIYSNSNPATNTSNFNVTINAGDFSATSFRRVTAKDTAFAGMDAAWTADFAALQMLFAILFVQAQTSVVPPGKKAVIYHRFTRDKKGEAWRGTTRIFGAGVGTFITQRDRIWEEPASVDMMVLEQL